MNIRHLYKEIFSENDDRHREVYFVQKGAFSSSEMAEYEARNSDLESKLADGVQVSDIEQLNDMVADIEKDIDELNSLVVQLGDWTGFDPANETSDIDTDQERLMDAMAKVNEVDAALGASTDLQTDLPPQFQKYKEAFTHLKNIEWDWAPEDAVYSDPADHEAAKTKEVGGEVFSELVSGLKVATTTGTVNIYSPSGVAYSVPADSGYELSIRPGAIRQRLVNPGEGYFIPVEYGGRELYVHSADVTIERSSQFSHRTDPSRPNKREYTLNGMSTNFFTDDLLFPEGGSTIPPESLLILAQGIQGERLRFHAQDSLDRGELDIAIANAREILKANPDSTDAMLVLVQAYKGKDMLRGVRSWLDKYESLVPQADRDPVAIEARGLLRAEAFEYEPRPEHTDVLPDDVYSKVVQAELGRTTDPSTMEALNAMLDKVQALEGDLAQKYLIDIDTVGADELMEYYFAVKTEGDMALAKKLGADLGGRNDYGLAEAIRVATVKAMSPALSKAITARVEGGTDDIDIAKWFKDGELDKKLTELLSDANTLFQDIDGASANPDGILTTKVKDQLGEEKFVFIEKTSTPSLIVSYIDGKKVQKQEVKKPAGAYSVLAKIIKDPGIGSLVMLPPKLRDAAMKKHMPATPKPPRSASGTAGSTPSGTPGSTPAGTPASTPGAVPTVTLASHPGATPSTVAVMNKAVQEAIDSRKDRISRHVAFGLEKSPAWEMFQKADMEDLLTFQSTVKDWLLAPPHKKTESDWKAVYKDIYRKVKGTEQRGALALFGNPHFLYEMINRATGINKRQKLNASDYHTGAEFLGAMATKQYEKAHDSVSSANAGFDKMTLLDPYPMTLGKMLSRVSPEGMPVTSGPVTRAFAIRPNLSSDENPLYVKFTRLEGSGKYVVSYGDGTSEYKKYPDVSAHFAEDILYPIIDERLISNLRVYEVDPTRLTQAELEKSYKEYQGKSGDIKERAEQIDAYTDETMVRIADAAGLGSLVRPDKITRVKKFLTDNKHHQIQEKLLASVRSGKYGGKGLLKTRAQQGMAIAYLRVCGYTVDPGEDRSGGPTITIYKNGLTHVDGDTGYKVLREISAAEMDASFQAGNAPKEADSEGRQAKGNRRNPEGAEGPDAHPKGEVGYTAIEMLKNDKKLTPKQKRIVKDIYWTFRKAVRKKGRVPGPMFKKALATPANKLYALDPSTQLQVERMVENVANPKARLGWGGTKKGTDNLIKKGQTVDHLIMNMAYFAMHGQLNLRIHKFEDYIISGNCNQCNVNGTMVGYRFRRRVSDRIGRG